MVRRMSGTSSAAAGLGFGAPLVAVLVAGVVGGLLGVVVGVGLTGAVAPGAPKPIDLSAVQNPTYDTP